MSEFIELVETFVLPALSVEDYCEKIDGLLNRFPRFKHEVFNRIRIVFPYKYPKTADNYVSMKFCTKGRVPVYGIYKRKDLQLIAVCVEKILYAIDDCDLNPILVPDLKLVKVNLGIRHSSLAVAGSLSYTRLTICSAVSTLSLGYTPGKEDEWTRAVVLLTGFTTQAVRYSNMLGHLRSGFYLKDDAQHIPDASILSLQAKWRKVSKAIRRDNLPYFYKFYDPDDGKICTGSVSNYSSGYPVRLIDDGENKTKSKYEKITGQAAPALGASQKLDVEKTKSLELCTTSESAYPGMSGVFRRTLAAAALCARHELDIEKTKSLELCGTSESAYPGMSGAFRRNLAAAALWARQKLDVEKTKSLELCGTSESAYPGMSGVFRRTLAAAALGARQKLNVDNFKSIESCGTSASAYSGLPDVFRRTLAAAASGTTQKVSTSMKDLCFDQFGATCVYPSQDIMTRMEAQQSNNTPHSSMSNVFRRTLRHKGSKGFEKGLLLVAKGLLSKK